MADFLLKKSSLISFQKNVFTIIVLINIHSKMCAVFIVHEFARREPKNYVIASLFTLRATWFALDGELIRPFYGISLHSGGDGKKRWKNLQFTSMYSR